MYGGGGGVGGNEAENEEFLKQQQSSSTQYNFNYYDSSTIPPASSVTPEYPTASTGAQFNQFSHSASAGSATGRASAFDNIDISRNKKYSGGTPFETVHEFVSVSNKVKRSVLSKQLNNYVVVIIQSMYTEIPKLFGFYYSSHWSTLVNFHLLIISLHPSCNFI